MNTELKRTVHGTLWFVYAIFLIYPAFAAAQPNIILVLADDQAWNGTSVRMHPDWEYSASDFYQTPNLERLAATGMRFSSAYSASPVCSSTRAAFQTGLSPAQLQLTDIVSSPNPRGASGLPLTPPQWKPVDTDIESLARRVAAADPRYVTGHVGKWHLNNGTLYQPPTELDLGFDFFDRAERTVPGSEDPGSVSSRTAAAITFLDDRAANNDPFFLQISHFAVHNPVEARPEDLAKYQALPPGVRHTSASYAAYTEHLDTGLGLVLDRVRDLGLEDNTYVIYYSDNGARRAESVSDPLFRGKGTLFEGGIRVPLIISGPGIAANSHSSVPVTTVDLYATISELVGNTAPLPAAAEGASLAPLLFNNGELPDGMEHLVRQHSENGALYFHYPINHGIGPNYRVRPHSAVRSGDFKLVRFYGENGNPDEVHLFNLAANITESEPTGIAFNGLALALPEKTQELLGMLDRWLVEVDASLPYDVAKPVTLKWSAANAGLEPNVWRATTKVQQYFRETWKAAGEATTAPVLQETSAFQPGLGGRAFEFDGESGLTRMFFHVSDSGPRADSKPSTGIPDFDRSVSFELWVQLDDLAQSHVLLESGWAAQGLSLTVGDADGTGQNDDLRFRVVGAGGTSITSTVEIDRFARPTDDFVHIVAVYNDSSENRYAEVYINGALFGRTDGLSGAENSIYWDGFDGNGVDDAGLGASAGALGGSSGTGSLPFAGHNLRGSVGQFVFHNYAIDSSEIQQSFNRALGPGNLGLFDAVGDVITRNLRPTALAQNERVADYEILIMHERTDSIGATLAVDLRPNGGETVVVDGGWSSNADSLPAETRLTSYLVHFDPIAAMSATGSITFSRPILGVILESDKLKDSDPILGSIGRFPDQGRSIRTEGSAMLSFSSDLRTLEISLTSLHLDVVQLRILTEAVIAGDYNGDGVVNAADYSVWRDAVESMKLAADGNGDGNVDTADYTVWKSNFGATAFGGALDVPVEGVPEPTTFYLLLLLCVGTIALRAAYVRALRSRAKLT